MAPKRKSNQLSASAEPTGREKKKQRIADARTIAVQPVPFTDGNQNAGVGVLGPSRTVTFESMEGLPSTLDVEKFSEARAFEINAMQDAMKNASSSSTQRVWQALPRHLRRRAASHDVHRVPLRLREKARAEMDPVRRKAIARSMPKRGKRNRVSRTESLLKRQREKTWLETHIWHAKRMHMKSIWGHRLAMQPTEKSFRPSHRASVHGAILHDASYYSLIELKGPQKVLKTVLEACCDPQGQGPGAQRYLTGARALDTHIHKPGSYPFDLIAPITIIWRPVTPNSPPVASAPPPPAEHGTNRKKQKKKKKKVEKTLDESCEKEDTPRTVWIRSHPSVFDDVLSTLQASASTILNVIRDNGKSDVEVQLADLRGAVNVFEIMGAKASQVIKGALTPVSNDRREEFQKFWASLRDLQTAGSVPRGMVIGFKVYDPRLKFPPKNVKSKVEDSPHLSSQFNVFPTAALAQSEIWDEPTRMALKVPRYKKKDIDERKSKNLVPGTSLSALRQDDRVPVILIQRSLEPSASLAPSSMSSQRIHGYTLFLPAGWSMPFFSSLTHTGTRVGGLRERQTQSFESGVAYFPRDYPCAKAAGQEEEERAEEERERWERKPPAKRCNWEKVGTRSPWRADWEVVLGLESGEGSGQFMTTQREGTSGKDIRPWLFRGPDIAAILASASKLLSPSLGVHSEINRLRLKRDQMPLGNITADDLWAGALVRIQLKMCTRGSPGDLAVIYSIGDEEAKKWKAMIGKHRNSDGDTDQVQLSEIRPLPSSIIGYITTGNFSLSRGEGFGIGAIPIARLFELQTQAHRLQNTLPLVKIRDRDDTRCRAAFIEVLEG